MAAEVQVCVRGQSRAPLHDSLEEGVGGGVRCVEHALRALGLALAARLERRLEHPAGARTKGQVAGHVGRVGMWGEQSLRAVAVLWADLLTSARSARSMAGALALRLAFFSGCELAACCPWAATLLRPKGVLRALPRLSATCAAAGAAAGPAAAPVLSRAPDAAAWAARNVSSSASRSASSAASERITSSVEKSCVQQGAHHTRSSSRVASL